MRFNLGKAFLPPLMLHVHLTKIGHEEGFLSIGFVGDSQAGSPHDTIPELDVRMAATERWQCRENCFLFNVAVIVSIYNTSG